MAATLSLSCGDDRDSFPCTAPSPLPPPQSRSLSPDPDVALTPERSCAGRAGGGILRRRLQGRPPRRQVRFRLGSVSEEPRESSREVPRRAEPAEEAPGESGSLPTTAALKAEPRRGCGAEGLLQTPSVLATPVPHSTLALGAEVQSAQEQGFDARQAAEALVQSSFVARCAVEAQVGPGMNIPRDQQLYQGLVSLRVPEDELLSSAVQEKLALVRHRPEAKRQPDCAGPDLLAFHDPRELLTESPCLDVPGLPPPRLRPRPRPPATAFFMYRKLQQWDS
ncbi:protein phosphatase 1 regulatory subunit 35 isoform X2 [Varanus komodoensis]|uniref:protein phosphatase 1 regulatory subunit 35 isoform X2 n=1 Tax=Varanus komodoensis TaxID=61221 RepID=UPI001CF7C4D8|nr:protein phosphatase 1 regulatory subunit 35 isoform X2 [Varanus komodoensis]